jgi:hypothetical protein
MCPKRYSHDCEYQNPPVVLSMCSNAFLCVVRSCDSFAAPALACMLSVHQAGDPVVVSTKSV